MFMVRGLFSNLTFPYVQFPCTSLSGEQIYPLVWDCIGHLEVLGFKVLTLTADGASCNRKFMRMHFNGKEKDKSDNILYKVDNIYAKDNRKIFFFSDIPHLLKTTRNCWANSFAHTQSRKLWVRTDMGL